MRDRIEAEVSAGGDLPYLSAVVKETFRLHPPVWLLLRDVLRPTRLGEWAFTPGDRLMICLRLLHSDPRWWAEPEVFNPDRWLGSRRLANPSVYLPFGTGPRACFGARLATVQLLAGLVYLWAHTRIELDDPDDMRETYSALLFPAQGHGRLWLRS